MTTPEPQLHRGLQGIVLDRTETTFIDGKNGVLEYRGYSIHELAKKSTFEETSYLLLYGELPSRSQFDEFDKALKISREIPHEVLGIIEVIKDSHPMDVLRTAVSALSSLDPARDDQSVDAIYKKGIRLTSQVPTIILAHHHIRNGREPIPPSKELGHAANFLYMLYGDKPKDEAVSIIDSDFVLHADHGLNASAFTARVATGTRADFHAAITAAIATLSGPLHGGAAENVMQMAREIGNPENAAEYVTNLLANKKRVMGFGHRVYKSEDPRARHLREGVKNLSEQMGQTEWYRILENVQAAMAPYARRGIHVNVDFFAGVIYHLLGIPQNLFVPIFTAGRIPGWTIQIVEQFRHNILIRPLLSYQGQHQRQYIPIEER